MRKKDIRLDEICTRDDFLAGYRREKVGEKALAVLEEHDIFPVNLANPMTELVTILGLYSYFSGSLLISPRGRASGEIGSKYAHRIPVEKLGMTFNPRSGSVDFGQNGAFYVRLLAAMGFHVSDGDPPRYKAITGSTFPAYLTRLVDEHEHLNRLSRTRANVYLKNLIAVWFDANAEVRGNTSVRVSILSQPKRKQIEAEAQFLADAMACVYPDVGITSDDCSINTEKHNGILRGFYRGYFNFTIDHLLAFQSHKRPPMKYQAAITPHFGF